MRAVMTSLAILLVAGLSFAEEKPKYSLVPGWEPAIGAEGNIVNPQGEGVYVAFSSPAWTTLVEATRARDRAGIAELVKNGGAALIPNATPILFLKEFETKQTVGFNGVRKVTVTVATSWEVRIKDGDQKDKKGIVSAGYVCKLASGTSETETASKKTKTFKADREANKASNAFRAARRLESEGKTEAAVNSYKAVAKQYPESPEARMATARVKALSK